VPSEIRNWKGYFATSPKNGQVIHQRRTPIAGLYASGIVAARSELGAGYQAGLNLASGMTFSYLAVRHMLKQSAA
jgi:hypothetical protein